MSICRLTSGTELDAAMKEVASYDGVLIALFKEWANDRGVADAFSFVCAPFEADHQMVQLQRDLSAANPPLSRACAWTATSPTWAAPAAPF